MKRSEYMQALTDCHVLPDAARKKEAKAIHYEYYLQFKNDDLKSIVLDEFGIEKLKAAYEEDQDFNIIPLDLWESLALSFYRLVDKNLLKESGQSISLATAVCTLKVIAEHLVTNDQ